MSELNGLGAIITGGTRGIGKAIAQTLLERGCHVLIMGQSNATVDDTLEEIDHENLYGFAGDVSDEEAVAEMFAYATEVLNTVDILVNNAGIAIGGPTAEMPLETFQKVLDINLTGAFLCAREAMRIMTRQGKGRIINIGSIASQVPRKGAVPYTTSKFGIQGMTRALAVEGRDLGIMVSCIHPGNVYTDFWNDKPNNEPMIEPQDVAHVVVAMLTLPQDVNLIDATVLNQTQPFLGRG
jgi:NAD(P)-dependent dehydrogenase (short-subunit alcohol dehydrogenase family)